MVPPLSHNIKGQTHSRVSECDGQPPIQVQPSAVDRMVTASTGVQTDLPEVVHSSCGPVCHSSEPQTPSSLRVPNPRPKVLRHRCSEHKLDGSHCLCLPSNGSPSQDDPKDQAMPLPDHRNSPRLARDALVLGPSAALNRDPTTTPSVNDPQSFLGFLASHRSGPLVWDTVNRTQTGIFQPSFYLLYQNLRKNNISSSLSCNPATGRLHSAFSPTW